MLDPREILKALFHIFDQSARSDLQRFIAAQSGITKWMIAADFCLHDPSRPNNTFVFSFIPYDDYFDALVREIRDSIRKDLKNTRDVRPSTVQFLREGRRFHIAFVLSSPPTVFSNGPDGGTPLQVARESIAIDVEMLGREAPPWLKKLREESKANGFNTELLADLYLLAYLFGFVSLVLARETTVQRLGWFADRDRMTTFCDGVLWHIAASSLHGLSEHFKVPLPADSPTIATPTPDTPAKEAMWYDELVRIPDYIAGILAAWDFEANLIPDKEKYGVLARQVIADASNMAVLQLRYEAEGFRASRRVFSLPPPAEAT